MFELFFGTAITLGLLAEKTTKSEASARCKHEAEQQKKQERQHGIEATCRYTFRGVSKMLDYRYDIQDMLVHLYTAVTSKYYCGKLISSFEQNNVVHKLISRTGMNREEFIVWLVNKFYNPQYFRPNEMCYYNGKWYIEVVAYNGLSYVVDTQKILIEYDTKRAVERVNKRLTSFIQCIWGDVEDCKAKSEQYVKENIKAYTFFETDRRTIDELLKDYDVDKTFALFYGSSDWKNFKYDETCATYFNEM